MLSIRLSRTGKIHAPHYRIVVQEKRSKLNGKTVDIIGHYHPANKDKALVIDKEKAALWLGRGAQASDTVTNLFVKQGILEPAKRIARPVKEVAAPEVVAEEVPAAVEETVVEETPAAEEAAAE